MIGRYGKRKQRGNVLRITQDFSRRSVAKAVLCVRVGILVALGTLVLAGNAQAIEPVGEPPTVGGSSGSVGEQPTVGGTIEHGVEPPKEGGTIEHGVEAPKEGGTIEHGVEPPKEGGTAEQVVEAPKEGGTIEHGVEPPKEGGTAEQVVEPPKEGGTAEQVVEPPKVGGTAEQVVDPPTTIVPTEAVTEKAKELAPPVTAIREHGTEAASSEPIAQQGSEGASSSLAVASQDGATSGPSQVAAEGAGALIGSLATGLAPRDPGGPAASSPAHLGATGAPVQLNAVQGAGGLSCEFSRLAASVTGGCTVSWLGDQSVLGASRDLVRGAPAAADAPGGVGGGYDGSAGWSRSVPQSPGPAPSGAFGGSATGGSGIALSGFFTLAGLLLLAAPRAMRRLRLLCQPWLTAFFVLIPERPG
jgi:hypothetical protein